MSKQKERSGQRGIPKEKGRSEQTRRRRATPEAKQTQREPTLDQLKFSLVILNTSISENPRLSFEISAKPNGSFCFENFSKTQDKRDATNLLPLKGILTSRFGLTREWVRELKLCSLFQLFSFERDKAATNAALTRDLPGGHSTDQRIEVWTKGVVQMGKRFEPKGEVQTERQPRPKGGLNPK